MRLAVLVPALGDREGRAAVAWGRARGYAVLDCDAQAPPPSALDATHDVLWCHAGQAVPVFSTAWKSRIRAWVDEGGSLLLSLLATPLAHDAGAPGPWPDVQRPVPWRHADDPLWAADFRDWPGFPHIRGVQGWGQHPLYDGLQRGTFTWTATEGEAVGRTMFRRPRWPQGRVVGVDRAYVRLDAETAVAWEYALAAGRILCLGANVSLTAADHRLDAQRDRYLINAIASLDPHRPLASMRRDAWPATTTPAITTPGVPSRAHVSSAPIAAPCALSPIGMLPVGVLTLEGHVDVREAHRDAPFTLAGRRAFVVGTEQDGVCECWIHPLCVMQELRPAVAGVPLRATAVTVTPGSIVRQLVDANGGSWREVVAVSPERAAIVYELAPVHADPLTVCTLALTSRLRLQWPMSADALHPVTADLVRAPGRVALSVRGSGGRAEVRVAVDGAADASLHADPAVVQLSVRAQAGEALRLAMVATAEGDLAAAGLWHAVRVDTLPATLASRARLDRDRAAATMRVATPFEQFDTAWEWAKARLASCLVQVPGVGTSLVAGYAASRPGWGDSRPGYAWFFGRDACWSADALLAAGMFSEARCALEFLASTADVTGKIAHEVTTSGVAHYDAADSTPLWLRLVAQYADWTGDLATVRGLWDRVRAALAFVVSCDRDGDGLPENDGVGHGWVESGPLGGGAVTTYVAAIWIDALRRLEPVARTLGDLALAERIATRRALAVTGFERRLRDPVTGRAVLQIGADGVAATDRTALAAVPILLGVDLHPSAETVLDELLGDDCCAPWGVRLLGRRDARYRPRGYHFGAVWPLFTGWTSLAAFAHDRADEGWRLASMTAARAFTRQRGAFDEVLDGDDGSGAGVCPDQAWSAAMVIAPIVYGMLGAQPDATRSACELRPRWPASWTHARLSGVRVGASRFSVTMTREGPTAGQTLGRVRLECELEHGPPLTVRLLDDAGETTRVLTRGYPATVTWPPHPREADGER
ncbi:MAG: hypothetical protein IT360_22945 [Gemmatimonadaceae bacterium]|nr:hypothetical protein [Gemmatimonadaceae bacterium]